MEYLLIDLENVSPQDVLNADKDLSILIFFGEKQDSIKSTLVQSTQPRGEKVEWIRITGCGKNALDFHIAFYLGRISKIEPNSHFTILSKDKGFDPLVQHMNAQAIHCNRMEAMAGEKGEAGALAVFVREIEEHFKKEKVDMRPKNRAKLKAYLSHRFKIAGGMVDAALENLIQEKKIAVSGNRIQYHLSVG
ncbi:MAG: PIN domain-containing protein [Fibrobacteria bacterium]